MAAIFDGMKRIDTILIDLCRDFWQYVSMEYFKQKIKAGEVGSSAMPGTAPFTTAFTADRGR